MGNSLRDQLLKSGLVEKNPPGRPTEKLRANNAPAPRNNRRKRNGNNAPPRPNASIDGGEIDLAKAYAARAKTDAAQRRQTEKAAAEQTRQRRERKQQLKKLLDGSALNKAEAEHARNFEYAGKIRRIHVDAAQLVALNAGELGVVQHGGRYLLVTRAVAEQVGVIDASQVALLVAPGGADVDDDGVPDDLIW